MNENECRISWKKMFFEIAKVAAKRSKDPKTQVGACLVKDNCVIGIGYNGSPRGFELDFDWGSPAKYDYVVHAEMNAIANACAIGANVAGSDIYVTLSPCHDCMKLLAQHRIRNVFFLSEYRDKDISMEIARECGIGFALCEDSGEEPASGALD